jgi:PAS domain S-box-containing protein
LTSDATAANASPSNPESSQEIRRKLELLIRSGLSLANSPDLQSMVQAATDAGLELCGAAFGAFFYNVIDAQGESYLLYTIAGVPRERFSNFPMPRNTAVFGPTFEGTGIVRSPDITRDPRYGRNAPLHGMPPGHLPVRSYLAVPVQSQSGEVLGGLFYGHSQVEVFTPESEELVATVAAQAAVAIENFRLRESLTRKIEALETVEASQRAAARPLAELAAIVESSNDAIIAKDLNGTIRSWNHAATRILGYTSDEMIGQPIYKLIPEELHDEEQAILARLRAGERIHHFETVRVTRSGTRIDVSLTISPLRDAGGTIIGASKILRDISDRKRIEKSILQAEKIAASGRMAATIAHEINNPLEAVMNLLYLARHSAGDPARVAAYLSGAEAEVNRVSHIARQTLGFYRENASASPTSLAELAADTLAIYAPRCESAGIAIEQHLPATTPLIMRKGEIMQVVSNLIANSYHAMPDGGRLRISVESTTQPEPGLSLTVEDTGIGIPAEQLPRIFEAFYSTRGAIGTGIGLFIARQFIEGHGGTIEVQSSTAADNHGTVVKIFLPFQNPYSTAASTDTPPSALGRPAIVQ